MHLYYKDWCVNVTLVSKHCSQLVEFLIVKCWPFYLPRDFTIVIVAVVYIAPSTHDKGNANKALGGLHDAISELLTFNHTSLKAVFPKLLTFKPEERTCRTPRPL